MVGKFERNKIKSFMFSHHSCMGDNRESCLCLHFQISTVAVSIVSKANTSIKNQCAEKICRGGSTLHCKVVAKAGSNSEGK